MLPDRPTVPLLKQRGDLIQEDPPDTPSDRVYGMRTIRRKQILDLVRRKGSLSRVEITAQLAQNNRTVSECVDELVREGLLLEKRERNPNEQKDPYHRNPIGRPPIAVSLNTGMACAVGLDFGRKHLVCQAMDLGNKLLGKSEMALSTNRVTGATMTTFEKFIGEFFHKYAQDLPPIAGVGVTFAGVYYHVENSKEVLEPIPQQVVSHLEKLTGAPVIVQESTAMLTLGEMWFSDEEAPETFAAINVSEGLGAALVEKGRLWLGVEKRGGDLGHLQLGEKGIQCFCGRTACLENIASSTGIERLAAKAGLTKNGKPIRTEDLARMAREGSAPARKIWKTFGKALGTGIDNIVVLTNPKVVLISGPVSRYADLFLDDVSSEIEEGALPKFRRSTQLAVSRLHEDAICAGACASVLRRVFGASQEFLESIV